MVGLDVIYRRLRPIIGFKQTQLSNVRLLVLHRRESPAVLRGGLNTHRTSSLTFPFPVVHNAAFYTGKRGRVLPPEHQRLPSTSMPDVRSEIGADPILYRKKKTTTKYYCVSPLRILADYYILSAQCYIALLLSAIVSPQRCTC